MEAITSEMTIEKLKAKVGSQSSLITELTKENEVLYHQYNHLIIRNGKMLQRTDEYQKIIDDLLIRNQELQLINNNLMMLNDNLRKQNTQAGVNGDFRQDQDRPLTARVPEIPASQFNLEELCVKWKKYPGQTAQNIPNLRKQIVMLLQLYSSPSLRAEDLFYRSGVGGVTGARYVSALKKFELIRYTGARKKGQYQITQKGKMFIEDAAK